MSKKKAVVKAEKPTFAKLREKIEASHQKLNEARKEMESHYPLSIGSKVVVFGEIIEVDDDDDVTMKFQVQFNDDYDDKLWILTNKVMPVGAE